MSARPLGRRDRAGACSAGEIGATGDSGTCDPGEALRASEILILPVLQDRAHCEINGIRIEGLDAEQGRRVHPVNGLGYPRRLLHVEAAEPFNCSRDLGSEIGRRLRHPQPYDLDGMLKARVVDPVVQAAPFECIVQVAGSVRSKDDDRGDLRSQGADFGHGDRGFGEHLEQEGLELLVGSLWLSILAASAAGLFFPRIFAPLLAIQAFYKLIWLLAFVVPAAVERARLPAGVAACFAAIVLTWPVFLWLAFAT